MLNVTHNVDNECHPGRDIFKLWHFHKNIRSCVENECCCPRIVNISNVDFTSKHLYHQSQYEKNMGQQMCGPESSNGLSIRHEFEGWGFESPSGRDIFCLKKIYYIDNINISSIPTRLSYIIYVSHCNVIAYKLIGLDLPASIVNTIYTWALNL